MTLATLAGRLHRLSLTRDGDNAIAWPDRLTDEDWCFSHDLLSHPDLAETEARRLAFWEAVNFFSLNFHGERPLMAGLAARAGSAAYGTVAPYLAAFEREEAAHSAMFATFCERYAGRLYPEKTIATSRRQDPVEPEILFFAQTLFFEELMDLYNRRMAEDPLLHPVIRRIHALHHRDETGHILFGRRILRDLVTRHDPDRGALRRHLMGFVRLTWMQLYNADAYRDAGLDEVYARRNRAWVAQTGFRHAMTQTAGHHLLALGLLDTEVLP
ncbi:MAG TPA: diiron oxygenase [Stellaceae bacterium]|nr:diiron oxygenase [Stellaceae bacterium]